MVSQNLHAKRFQFRLNDQYYVQNVEIDETCQKFMHRGGFQARVISDSAIITDEANLPDETSKPKKKQFDVDKFISQHQDHIHYFQLRIDELGQDYSHSPRICVGLCREDFMVNKDVNDQQNVWCLNLNTGDKYHNLKWREYYQVPKPQGSRVGFKKGEIPSECIQVGSVVGIMINTKEG